MKFVCLLTILFLTVSCNKPKTVLICGDHICINKKEAKQYFEENLTIQVKILDKKVKNDINLVELNLRTNQQGKKEVRLFPKKLPSKNLKKLSKDEKSFQNPMLFRKLKCVTRPCCFLFSRSKRCYTVVRRKSRRVCRRKEFTHSISRSSTDKDDEDTSI